ncbi:hypothetical protein P153DRAFT_412683 [Dothidotthia symphoricarpi CBS 119687]|uniref:Uncharacterized protein n=1 Tax=Dothidotthia symphoricarpi CBS 119687 TaxID=1392245 RepID=A0A6A5ZVA8_9PLEO|nr:uncharacterized protein P153DRAFT_412683 [Dothidotthia symphoricarpi CBS 119687]KAF2123652.1 hypothetical protein P153DRAFT_412683 [Dothidotthia symphoricarpi CBS 119687]
MQLLEPVQEAESWDIIIGASRELELTHPIYTFYLYSGQRCRVSKLTNKHQHLFPSFIRYQSLSGTGEEMSRLSQEWSDTTSPCVSCIYLFPRAANVISPMCNESFGAGSSWPDADTVMYLCQKRILIYDECKINDGFNYDNVKRWTSEAPVSTLGRTGYLSQTAFKISNRVPHNGKAAISNSIRRRLTIYHVKKQLTKFKPVDPPEITTSVILKFVSLCVSVANAYDEAPTSLATVLYTLFRTNVNKIMAGLVYDVGASRLECVPATAAMAIRCGVTPKKLCSAFSAKSSRLVTYPEPGQPDLGEERYRKPYRDVIEHRDWIDKMLETRQRGLLRGPRQDHVHIHALKLHQELDCAYHPELRYGRQGAQDRVPRRRRVVRPEPHPNEIVYSSLKVNAMFYTRYIRMGSTPLGSIRSAYVKATSHYTMNLNANAKRGQLKKSPSNSLIKGIKVEDVEEVITAIVDVNTDPYEVKTLVTYTFHHSNDDWIMPQYPEDELTIRFGYMVNNSPFISTGFLYDIKSADEHTASPTITPVKQTVPNESRFDKPRNKQPITNPVATPFTNRTDNPTVTPSKPGFTTNYLATITSAIPNRVPSPALIHPPITSQHMGGVMPSNASGTAFEVQDTNIGSSANKPEWTTEPLQTIQHLTRIRIKLRRISHDFARIGLPKLSIAPIFEILRESMPAVLEEISITNGYTHKLYEAMKIISGMSSLAMAVVVISVASESEMENGKVVPTQGKYELSVKIHNVFHIRRVSYHNPKQSSSTGFEVPDNIFTEAEALHPISNVTSMLGATSSAFAGRSTDPFSSFNAALDMNSDIVKQNLIIDWIIIGIWTCSSSRSELGSEPYPITYAGMYLSAVEKVKAIPERKKDIINISKVNTVQATIGNQCMDATLKMMSNLNTISDSDSYPDVYRATMMVANLALLRHVCVRISPHENRILPAFATALAYSPRLCIGCTPSVQVMSQIISMSAIKVKRFVYVLGGGRGLRQLLPRDYQRSVEEALELVPLLGVVTDIVMIHSAHGFRITVISMGANADKSIDDATSLYPDMNKHMRLTKTINPATMSRMNVSKSESHSPIDDKITIRESHLDTIVNRSRYITAVTGFNWVTYPNSVLDQFIGLGAVGSAVEALVDQAPDQLLNRFVVSTGSLYNKMSDYDLQYMMEGMDVNESVTNRTPISSSTNKFYSETMPESTSAQRSVPVNPFIQAIESTQTSSNNNPNRNSPYMFPQRSQLGQLLDLTGKGVSQQVIVVDNINQRCNELMMTIKQMGADMIEIVKRQTFISDRLKIDNRITEEASAEANKHLELRSVL